MIPENRLSSTRVPSGWRDTFFTGNPLVDIEYGGVALNDASQGIDLKPWTITYNKFNGDVLVSAAGVEPVVIFSRPGITTLSLAFDRNMQPAVAFTQDGQAKFYYYDVFSSDFVFLESELGAAVTPRCTHDDKRATQSAIGDVILAYVRAGVLRYRQQRDRYLIEYTLDKECKTLYHIGMNNKGRMQFATDNGGDEPPFLADVVADLLRKSGLRADDFDVTNLWTRIEGYRIAAQGGSDSMIEPLQAAYFFDPGQWDKKLRFVPRGGEPVAELTYDDLLERTDEESPFEVQTVQEIELLRKVNVTMVDSTAGYVPNKQTDERIAPTINATGESSIVIPITANPDFIATVARKRLRVPWGEPNKFKWAVSTRWSALTPTDVISVTDRKGRTYRMRLMQLDENYGEFRFDSTSDAPWVYRATAKAGVATGPSTPTIPKDPGETIMLVINCPVIRDNDDEVGYYVCAYGTGDGWVGATVQYQFEGFGSPTATTVIELPATAGVTDSALLPERDGEYLSNQTLRVTVKGELHSTTRENVLNGYNLAAVRNADGSWELLNFQTATPVAVGTYDLSGLVRGRKATKPGTVAAGGEFVLIDNAVGFFAVDRRFYGRPIRYRAVNIGESVDNADWVQLDDIFPQSQVEFPPTMVRRTGNAISWLGRPRLGMSVDPFHSKYFAGYRIKYSDGHEASVGPNVTGYTRAASPGTRVSVAGINSITGVGPFSEEITL